MTNQPEVQEKKLKKGFYLLPNLFTTAALFAGFYAVVAAMKGMFDIAAMAIFIAMVADGLDGRVARLTNTQSAFGAEYDSLSDMISFGIAPALVAYSWGLHTLGKLGWLSAFVYAAATALRLARFNTSTSSNDKRFFYGLPCPAAAAVVASTIWVLQLLSLRNDFLIFIVGVVTILMGVLMLSNVRYHSFKQVDLKGRVPFIAIIILVLVFVGIALDPPVILFLGFVGYAISGPIMMLFLSKPKRFKKRDNHHEE